MHWQIREISLIDGLISGAHRVNRVWASRISIGSSAIVTILDIRTGLVEVTINSQEEGGIRGLTWIPETLSRIKMPLCFFKAARYSLASFLSSSGQGLGRVKFQNNPPHDILRRRRSRVISLHVYKQASTGILRDEHCAQWDGQAGFPDSRKPVDPYHDRTCRGLGGDFFQQLFSAGEQRGLGRGTKQHRSTSIYAGRHFQGLFS